MPNKPLFQKHTSSWLLGLRVVEACILALVGRAWLHWAIDSSSVPNPAIYDYFICVAILLQQAIFSLHHLYKIDTLKSHLILWRDILFAWSLVALLLTLLLFISKTGATLSRLWLIAWWTSSFVTLGILHTITPKLLTYWYSECNQRRSVLIIGHGEPAKQVFQRLADKPWSGLEVVATLSLNHSPTPWSADLYQVKTLAQLSTVCDSHQIDEVWIALSEHSQIQAILDTLRNTTVTIRWVPDWFTLTLINHSVSEVAGMVLLNLNDTPMRGINYTAKWLEDKILAIIFILISSPLLILIAIGVKLSSPGPVFYRQERVSWNNQYFHMLKFRSMPVDAEKNTGPVWATPQEQRATAFGAFLRRTSLDELPQLFNVLKGDMSIVGPRPERPFFVEQFKDDIPLYMKKHLVKAGITGWAQVNGWRGNTDLHQRIQHDLYYIQHWSISFDLKIIFLTVWNIIWRRQLNAY